MTTESTKPAGPALLVAALFVGLGSYYGVEMVRNGRADWLVAASALVLLAVILGSGVYAITPRR